MTVQVSAEVLASAMWPQGDERDPLGIWSARAIAVGDASGGAVQCDVFVPANRRAAGVFTVYSANVTQIVGAGVIAETIKTRLLTNWPNNSPEAGFTGYDKVTMSSTTGAVTWAAPFSGPLDTQLISPLDRFILLLEPTPGAAAFNIMEIHLNANVDVNTWVFEAYGYYWDRAVLQAPGGPRHPGSS